MRSENLLYRLTPALPQAGPSPDGEAAERVPALAVDPPYGVPANDVAEPFLAVAAFIKPKPPNRGWTAAERDKPVESVRRRSSPLTLVGAIVLHLLPLLLLLDWPVKPLEAPPPIPVHLLVVPPAKPAPAPPAPPKPEKKPPSGPLASADMGQKEAKQQQPGTEPQPRAPQQAPEHTVSAHMVPAHMVSALPPPTPSPIPLPEPSDVQQQVAMLPPPPKPPAAPEARRRDPTPRLPAHLGIPGPAATRSEYLAYCNELIRRHFDMLPTSFVGDRRGLTVLSLLVLDDGRIARIAIVHSSGYQDIDERVERMVAAVGRFPPLPQWFQGSQMPLEYELPIPAGLARR